MEDFYYLHIIEVNAQLKALVKNATLIWENSHAQATINSRQTAARHYLSWCHYYGKVAFPATEATLILYVATLAHSKLAYGTIKVYMSGVRILHRERGLEAPCNKDDYHYQRVLQGIKRDLGGCVKQKLHITPQILLAMFAHIDRTDKNERMFYAACLLAFYTLFRKSNFTTPTEKGFVESRHLKRSDVTFGADGLMYVSSQWSKTNQYRDRQLVFPVAPASTPALNAVECVRGYLLADPAPNTDPMFRVWKKNKVVPMTGRWFAKKLTVILIRAGINAIEYSGHSFRAGGATWAFQCGLPGEMIKLMGDWKSEAYAGYLRLALQHRVAAAKVLAGKEIT